MTNTQTFNFLPNFNFKTSSAFYGQALLIGVIITVLGLMIIPVSPTMMDAMLGFNIVATLTVLIVAVSISDPMMLFSFPSLLLITTLFRLGLNISSTRLILSTGEAGEIINTFGYFVTGGNLAVGVILFLVLQIIQFMVIAKGSERVAEVAARFTLDALPGKQMSIDADLRAGLLTNEEARAKRAELIKESKFYGSMDGAMKFIKGESIAGFIIALVNVIGGFLIGVLQQGMDMSQAARHYTTLTIGDGLSAQIPAFILSLAAGFLVTRVTNASDDKSLGGEIGEQIFRNHRPIFTVAGIIFLASMVPGFPGGVLFFISIAMAGVGYTIYRKINLNKQDEESIQKYKIQDEDNFVRLGQTFPLVLEMSPNMYEQFLADARWQECFNHLYPRLRLHLSRQTGVPLPELKIQTNSDLPPNRYSIKIYEIPVDEGFLSPEHFMLRNLSETSISLASDGTEKQDRTVHGTPVLLMELAKQNALMQKGIKGLAPEEVLLKHLARVLKRHAKEFLGIQEVRNILSQMETHHAELVREVVPRLITVNKLTEVLKRLVDEAVSINDFRLILETLSGCQPDHKDPVALTEIVRIGLKRVITYQHTKGDNKISAFLLDPDMEKEILNHIQKTDSECYLTLDPEKLKNITDAIVNTYNNHGAAAKRTVILTNVEIRRYVRKIIENDLPDVAVLSYQELEANLIIDQRDVISAYINMENV